MGIRVSKIIEDVRPTVKLAQLAGRSRRGRLRTVLGFALGLALGLAVLPTYHAVRSLVSPGPVTGSTNAQADLLGKALDDDLTTGFLSPGHAFGGRFSAGTLVGQTQEYGGVVISLQDASSASGDNVMTVMLGLGPVTANYDAVNSAVYSVTCYQYSFGLYPRTVGSAQSVACPARRADGEPGSPIAEYGALLARQPAATPYAMDTSTYAQTPQGALDLLQAAKLVSATDTYQVVSAAKQGTVYVVAVKINGGCEFLRMDNASADTVVPLWLAPMQQQAHCDANDALHESALYGTSAAQEG